MNSALTVQLGFFCSTAQTSARWVRMTIQPRHCPPTKQCGGHWTPASCL